MAEKKEKTGALIEAIGKEKVQVDAAVEAGREDEEAAAGIKAEVEAFQEECAKDLEAAEPVIAEAEAALNSLDKASLGELKSFGSPAAEVVQVSFEHAHASTHSQHKVISSECTLAPSQNGRHLVVVYVGLYLISLGNT